MNRPLGSLWYLKSGSQVVATTSVAEILALQALSLNTLTTLSALNSRDIVNILY